MLLSLWEVWGRGENNSIEWKNITMSKGGGRNKDHLETFWILLIYTLSETVSVIWFNCFCVPTHSNIETLEKSADFENKRDFLTNFLIMPILSQAIAFRLFKLK